MDEEDKIKLTDWSGRMAQCGCLIRQFRNPFTGLTEWDFATICLEHQSMKQRNYEDWQWFVAYFQKRFFEPHYCYCPCHKIHPEGLRDCEECRCWWIIQKNWDAELEKANAREQALKDKKPSN